MQEQRFGRRNSRCLTILFLLCSITVSVFLFGFSLYEYGIEHVPCTEEVLNFRIRRLYADHFQANPFSDKVFLSSAHNSNGYVAIDNKTDERLVVNLTHDNGKTLIYTAQPGITYCLLTEGDGKYDIVCGKAGMAADVQSIIDVDLNEDELYLYPDNYVMFDKDSDIVKLCSTFPLDEKRYMNAVCENLAKNGTYTIEGERSEVWYVPSPDRFIKDYKGSCMDFASYTCAAFRMRGIPCRMVIGESSGEGHAWVEVMPSFTGSVAGFPMIEGEWCFLDPTVLVQENMNYIEITLMVPKFLKEHKAEYREDFAY